MQTISRSRRALEVVAVSSTSQIKWVFGVLFVVASAWTLDAQASQRVWFEGALTSAGGAPAADGDYDLTLALYAGKTAQAPSWSDGPVKVKVSGGRFAYLLGSGKALDSQSLSKLADPWIGVTVGKDPELPRVAIGGSLWASVASTATSVSCTGCVSVAALKFDGDVNLGGNSLKAKNGVFTGTVQAGAVVAQSFTGDGSNLTGLKLPQGACKGDQVVAAILADGSLKCVNPTATVKLPIDGLDDVSNGLLSNEFEDSASLQTALPIPDNTGVEAVAQVAFPKLGTPKAFKLRLKMSNSNLSKVSVKVLPPDDKAVGYVLCDPCGKVDEKQYDKTFSPSAPPQKGDLSKWASTSPAGNWTLKVLDTEFCVPQKPGNAALCDLTKKTDGQVTAFSVETTTVSDKKVQATGSVLMKGGLLVNGGLKIGELNAACSAESRGQLRWEPNEGAQVCNGTEWVANKPRPVFWQGGCSANGSSGWRYYCTDHTDYNTANRYLSVASQSSGSSTSSSTGRVTIKISGYYALSFSSWGVSHQRYFELYRGGTVILDGRNYNSGNSNNSISFNKTLWLDKGDTLNLRLYASGNTPSWYGDVATVGNRKVLRRTWWRIEYVGHNWKPGPVCGDGELDQGEQCDDGNTKDGDGCSATCKSLAPTGQLVWTALAPSSMNPTVTLGKIKGYAGKKIVIKQLGMCGDSTSSSGANRFYVSGGGVGFRFAAGQSNPGSVNQWLGYTPNYSGSAKGWVYKSVSYSANAGAELTIQWDYHSDWDGYYCGAPDNKGNKYSDSASSVRPWILYEYQ